MTRSTPAGVGSAKKRGPYLTPKTVAVQPMVDVIRHHRIVSELSLGYVLQAIGFFRSDRSEKFRPSDVAKFARRHGLNYTTTVPRYVTTAGGAAGANLVHNARHEAAVCAVELLIRFVAGLDVIDWDHQRRRGKHLADLYVENATGITTAVEIELTRKDNTRLREIARSHHEQVARGDYDRVLYLTDAANIHRAVTEHGSVLGQRLTIIDLNEFLVRELGRKGVLVVNSKVVV